MLKFRTMAQGAAEQQVLLEEQNEAVERCSRSATTRA